MDDLPEYRRGTCETVDEMGLLKHRLAALEKQVLSILRFLNEAMQEPVPVRNTLDGSGTGS